LRRRFQSAAAVDRLLLLFLSIFSLFYLEKFEKKRSLK